jgi:hypothetical protein
MLDYYGRPLPYRPVKRRPAGWQPDPGMVAINEVEAEFPGYNVDQVTAEVNRRGLHIAREFVEAVMAATKPYSGGDIR